MILDMTRMMIDLAHREILPIRNAAGTRIDCLRGRVWITEQPSAGDIVLEAGDAYRISHNGLAVVQALRDAVVGVRVSAVSAAKRRARVRGHSMVYARR